MISLLVPFQVEEVELIDKKGYLTISLSLAKEGKILLRKPEGIREWYRDLKVRREIQGCTQRLFPGCVNLR